MEVESVVRDHQQTNQEESGGETEQDQQVPQCQEAVASPEDSEPVNQTDHAEQPGDLKSQVCSDDNTEVRAPVSHNGNGHHADHSQNQGDDYDEQIDVVNSDHDENEVKSTENNVVLEENEPDATMDDSGPVEGTNENQNQDTTNENHQESQSPQSEDHPDQKESQSSEEEVTESILEKVAENNGVADNNEKNSEEQEDGPEKMQADDNESPVTEDQQKPSVENEEVPEETHSEDIKEVCPENESNCEPDTVSVENGFNEENEEREEVPEDLESEALEVIEPVEAAEAHEATEGSESTDITATNETMETEDTVCEEKETSCEQSSESSEQEKDEKVLVTESQEGEEKEREEEETTAGETAETEAKLVETEDEILPSECANNDGAEVESSKQTAALPEREEKGEDHDQLEENLECIVSPKKENDVSEEILVDDEDMVVTQITSIDELEVSHGTNGHAAIDQTGTAEDKMREEAANIDQFTELEDLIIHALDTVSPFDAKFISDHMPGRDEQQIERRLTDHSFRKLSFTFQKLPFLMFEMIFVSENNERSSSLMLLTQKSLLQLKNKHGWCDTSYNLEVLELRYNPKTRFGIDVGALCEFIITNIPSIHMPYLRRNVREIESFLEASNINYRKPNVKRDLKQLLNKVQQEVTMESLRVEGKQPIKIDEEGDLHLIEDHEEMLRKIVANVGIHHWEEVTKLLLAVFEYEVDVDLDDDEIYDKIRCYYESKLDPNLSSSFFTEEEDKCIIYMYKYWSKIMEDDQLWKQISQHLIGRSANQVKNRFLRTSQSPTDLTLENILKYPEDKSNPATYNSDLAHMFSLIIAQKNLPNDLEITSKLQQETRFLVLGTRQEMYILPCKDSAIRPHHPGVVVHTFTYDPSRPPQQFVTFVKLTFGNGLKKLGLLDDPDSFNFNNIELHSPSIHQMMEAADKERFIVPKDIFMLINRRMEAGQVVEFVLPVKRKYTRKVDRLDLHQRDDFQREKLKAKGFSPSPRKKQKR